VKLRGHSRPARQAQSAAERNAGVEVRNLHDRRFGIPVDRGQVCVNPEQPAQLDGQRLRRRERDRPIGDRMESSRRATYTALVLPDTDMFGSLHGQPKNAQRLSLRHRRIRCDRHRVERVSRRQHQRTPVRVKARQQMIDHRGVREDHIRRQIAGGGDEVNRLAQIPVNIVDVGFAGIRQRVRGHCSR
jgi:hypothetical protein